MIFLAVHSVLIIVLFIYFNRKYKKTEDLPLFKRGLRLYGTVIAVNDGDGFRFFHKTLFGFFTDYSLKNSLKIRIAGIDAPEKAYFKFKKQFYAEESTEFLRKLIFNKNVHLTVQRVDQYNRLVCFVQIGILKRDIAIDLLRSGSACVYMGSDSEYLNNFEKYKIVEAEAKGARRGMWKRKNVELPMDHKNRMKKLCK